MHYFKPVMLYIHTHEIICIGLKQFVKNAPTCNY